MRVWVEIGAPDAARVHKASKAAPRVAVYTHKDPQKVMSQWSGERIHRAADLELYAVERGLLDALAARLQRRMAFSLAVTSGHSSRRVACTRAYANLDAGEVWT